VVGFSKLPQELAPLVRNGDLVTRRVLDDTDNYCTAVVDLGAWLGPAHTGTPEAETAEEEPVPPERQPAREAIGRRSGLQMPGWKPCRRMP